MATVRIYSTPQCPYCRMVKAYLKKMGIGFEDVNVAEDYLAAKEMIELTGQRGVPVLVYGDDIIIGFDIERLRKLFGGEEVSEFYDVLIVGGGPSGLTAGVYCGRKLLNTAIITEDIGGQALESWAIENYMGYRMVSGEDLIKKFEEQVRIQDIDIQLDAVSSVTKEEAFFSVTTKTGQKIKAKAIIIATGRRSRKLGLEGEEKYFGKGISICATCDAPMFRDKEIAIVGGGNSAVMLAIEMSSIAKRIHMIVRSEIKADEIYLKKYHTLDNVTTYLNNTVSQLHGNDFLSGITISDRDSMEEHFLSIDGLFLAIGEVPNSGFIKGFVDLNDRGEIVVDENCHTTTEGIFAAGDVTSIKGKQVIIASGEGAKAALEAYEFIGSLDLNNT